MSTRRNRPRSSWRASSILVVLAAAFCALACGPGPTVNPRPLDLTARTEGTPEALGTHIDGLVIAYRQSPVTDPRVARANLDAYTTAAIKTAEAIWEHPDASPEFRDKAATMILEAWHDRLEMDDQAMSRIDEWADRITAEVPDDSEIRSTVAYLRYISVEDADASHFPDPSKKTQALIDAAIQLGQSSPMRPETAEILNELADRALAEGMDDRARDLLALLATRFGESPMGVRAAGVLKRLNSEGEVMDMIAGEALDGPRIDIEDHRGKVVLVIFWGTNWQDPATLPLDPIRALREANDDFAVLGVLYDENASRARQFLTQNEIDWPQIFENVDLGIPSPSPLALSFGIVSSPYYMVLDREGRLVVQGLSFEKLKPSLTELLDTEGTPPPAPVDTDDTSTPATADVEIPTENP